MECGVTQPFRADSSGLKALSYRVENGFTLCSLRYAIMRGKFDETSGGDRIGDFWFQYRQRPL